jgi:aspartokinase-like uncharacterized kinase
MDIAVIKVGGSLAEKPESLRALCKKLGSLSLNYGLVVGGGGGEFADVVRAQDKLFGLSAFVSHRMAILGMDAYGFLLSDLTPNSCIVNSLKQQRGLSEGKFAVFCHRSLCFLMIAGDLLGGYFGCKTAYIANKLTQRIFCL